jgi:hypothetical protein
MNERFIENCHIPLSYQKKEGTKGSFYQAGGKKGILPARISWGIFAQRKTSLKDTLKKNEINGLYKKTESGLYDSIDNRKIHSSIWGNEEYPEFYGYGIIDERFGIFDLLIIYSENQCFDSMEIHLFKGMGKPEFLQQAFNYLRNYKTKSPRSIGLPVDIYELGLY